jgi:hypothetical protein
MNAAAYESRGRMNKVRDFDKPIRGVRCTIQRWVKK